MKLLLKFFFHIILLNNILSNESQTYLEPNIFTKIDLTSDVTQILISAEDSNYITIHLIYSYPSKYITTFNQNLEEFELENDYKKNQTDLIVDSKLSLGMNIVILKPNKESYNTSIINISIFSKGIKGKNEFAYIKYTLSNDIINNKFNIKNEKINLKQDEDDLNISFSGINQINNTDLLEKESEYNIKTFDKETIETFYENIYISIYDEENISKYILTSETFIEKGNNILNDNNRKIKAKINDNKEQILLIFAKINSNNNEILLHYEYINFKVEKNDNNDDEDEVDVEKNRDKNLILLIIFCVIFLCVILITSIGVFCYLNCHEESEDISNIEGICIDKNSGHSDDDITDDSRKIDDK